MYRAIVPEASNILPIPRFIVERYVRDALTEDATRSDITTFACIEPSHRSRVLLRARQDLVVAGTEVAKAAFLAVDPTVEVQIEVTDGTKVAPNTTVMTIVGTTQSLLLAERVALNFMQRMSGIATKTRGFVDLLPEGSNTRITDTRKTTPLLRAIERYSVRAGGGHNHRDDLGSAVLIKDNHIAACKSVTDAIERCRRSAPHPTKIECEVDSMEQLHEALEAKADIILLDNFDNERVAEAIAINQGRAILEASGGITEERVTALATLGVDVISIGALTHSAIAVDLGLDYADTL